jgi:hypothetical protein
MAQTAAVVVALVGQDLLDLAAHMMAVMAALALNTPRTAQAVAAVAPLPVAMAALLAALAVSMAAVAVADLPEAGHQGLWVALALRV